MDSPALTGSISDGLACFMSLYRPQLIARLEQANCRPAAVSDSGLEFVDEVLDAWSRLPRAMRCALRNWQAT